MLKAGKRDLYEEETVSGGYFTEVDLPPTAVLYGLIRDDREITLYIFCKPVIKGSDES